MELVCVLNLSKCSNSVLTTLIFTVLKEMPVAGVRPGIIPSTFSSDIHVTLCKEKLYSELCNFSDRKCIGLRPIGKFKMLSCCFPPFWGPVGSANLLQLLIYSSKDL